MKKLQMILTMLLLLVTAPAALQAQLPTKRVLTLSLAKKIAAAAETEALRRGSTVVIAVVVRCFLLSSVVGPSANSF